MICKVCKKEFQEKTGRRPKKFCSDACKVKFWNSQKAVSVKNLNNQSTGTNQKPEKKAAQNQSINTTTKVYTLEELENELMSLGTGQWASIRRNFLAREILKLNKFGNH